jgi:hypothetical protein
MLPHPDYRSRLFAQPLDKLNRVIVRDIFRLTLHMSKETLRQFRAKMTVGERTPPVEEFGGLRGPVSLEGQSPSHVISRPQKLPTTRRREEMLRAASVRRTLARLQSREIQLSARRRNENIDLCSVKRASDEVDVCIVGGGPAGLSAAIRLKQLEQEKGREIRVVVIEKGSEIGKHTLLRPCPISTTESRFTHTLRCCYRASCSERATSELER